MYGNFEYGSIPYGDLSTLVAVIVINRGNIETIFMSNKSVSLFISEKKVLEFTSEKKQNVFITLDSVRSQLFVSRKYS